MKKFLVVLVAVLLIQASFAKSKKDKKKDSSSDSSDSSDSSEKKKSKKCPKCPESTILVIREVTACEGDLKKLLCPAGTSITIHEAFYGRKNPNTCPQLDRSRLTGQCSSPAALQVLRTRCVGRTECDLGSVNSWFSDPCPSTNKYLEVSFSCSSKQTTSDNNRRKSS